MNLSEEKGRGTLIPALPEAKRKEVPGDTLAFIPEPPSKNEDHCMSLTHSSD